MEKLQQDFLDLDVPSLCEIFRLKNEQEELADFSFSFGQSDLCEGRCTVQFTQSNACPNIIFFNC